VGAGNAWPHRHAIVDQRNVQHQVAAAIEPAAGRAGADGLDRALEGFQVRLVGHELHGTAHGAGSIQRPLRPPQHFHAIDVEQVGIDHHLAVEGRGGRCERIVVQIKTHRRRGAPRGGQAPHLELGLARSRGSLGNAGDRLDDSADTRDALLLQKLAGQRRHADRGVLHGGCTLLGGDDDLLQRIAAFGGGAVACTLVSRVSQGRSAGHAQ
jgi:hypothetical protein